MARPCARFCGRFCLKRMAVCCPAPNSGKTALPVYLEQGKSRRWFVAPQRPAVKRWRDPARLRLLGRLGGETAQTALQGILANKGEGQCDSGHRVSRVCGGWNGGRRIGLLLVDRQKGGPQAIV